jgi:hypothetical protein
MNHSFEEWAIRKFETPISLHILPQLAGDGAKAFTQLNMSIIRGMTIVALDK